MVTLNAISTLRSLIIHGRGLNENTNGLLRRFFPKGMAIGSVSEQEIKNAEFSINTRPRKALDYLSPYEFLTGKSVPLIAEI